MQFNAKVVDVHQPIARSIVKEIEFSTFCVYFQEINDQFPDILIRRHIPCHYNAMLRFRVVSRFLCKRLVESCALLRESVFP